MYDSLDNYLAGRNHILGQVNPVSEHRPEWNEAVFRKVLFKQADGDVTSAEFRALIETIWRLDLLIRRDEQSFGDFKRSWSHVDDDLSVNQGVTMVFEPSKASLWRTQRDGCWLLS